MLPSPDGPSYGHSSAAFAAKFAFLPGPLDGVGPKTAHSVDTVLTPAEA